MNKKILIAFSIFLIGFGVFKLTSNKNLTSKTANSGRFRSFSTNLEKYSIDPNQLLSGGPEKDGIPSLSDPKFIDTEDVSFLEDDSIGILIQVNEEERFYPFNILVWHEIVNDQIENLSVAVTFCPLCGSAIVFDRRVDDRILEFGVSGFLYESNMIMFDRQTESLWQQSTGESIMGDYLNKELSVVPAQRLSYKDVVNNHPNALIMSSKTGHSRNYTISPYGDYDNNDQFLFPTSVKNNKFPAKEIMYVLANQKSSVAFPISNLKEGSSSTYTVNNSTYKATKNNSEITVTNQKNDTIPGYYEMWFSWATQHQEDGEVWEIK
ncbi:DUF3179 domain-containing protein [Patescibacteria group bacterium]